MGSVVNILILTNLFLLLVFVVPPSSCRHRHHNGTVEEGGTKKDIITPLVTFAGSIASTYLMKWMFKDEAALATINNLSRKNLISEGCSAENAEIMDPPNDLKRRGGTTEVEAYREGTVGAGLKKLKQKAAQQLSQDQATSLWIRCSFKTPIRYVKAVPIGAAVATMGTAKDPPKTNRNTVKIIFLMSLRTNSNELTDPSRFAIAICTDIAQKPQEKCEKYETLAQMKDLVQPFQDLSKESKYDKIISSAKFEKGEQKEVRPIYLCNPAEGVSLCVSVMMGNGGKAVSQIYIHDWTEGFMPIDTLPSK